MSEQSAPAELAPKAKRGRGRQPGFVMSQHHRDKIRNSNILHALIAHVVDGKEMSSSQVTAGLGLIKKYLPDLQTTTLQGDEEGGPVNVAVSRIERVIKHVNAKD